MATIDHSAYAPSSPALGFGESVFGAFHNFGRAIRARIAYRRTLQALDTLSHRQLADIGLEGEDLRVVAARMAQQTVR